jgi:hypothetical protein
MSLNDFENVIDPDDAIISKIGSAVQAAMAAKESLNYALGEAIDSASTFGYELGAEDMKLKIIEAFEADDSVCVSWALGVIDAAVSRN